MCLGIRSLWGTGANQLHFKPEDAMRAMDRAYRYSTHTHTHTHAHMNIFNIFILWITIMDYMRFGADHLKNDRAILLGVDVPQTTEGLRLVQPSHLPDIQSKRAGPANNF